MQKSFLQACSHFFSTMVEIKFERLKKRGGNLNAVVIKV